MKKSPSLPLMKMDEADILKEQKIRRIKKKNEVRGTRKNDEPDELGVKLQCMSLHKKEPTKQGEGLPWEKYGAWRQKQKTEAAKLEKQLKAKWALGWQIEEQLNLYRRHYNQAVLPTKLKDIAEFLMPKRTPPHELAAVSWLGDWRPSSILNLLQALASSSSSKSPSLSTSIETNRLLSQLIHEVRIEEAVIDEEMAEIQATCVLHLPFAPINKQSGSAALRCIQSEFKKIQRVITKAQQLRLKALELAVKKVLCKTDAAEFLVAFAGIQDAINQFAANQRFQNGPVSVPVKALGHAKE